RAVGHRTPTPDDFPPLDDVGWLALREIGTLRVEPITFQLGTDRLDDGGKAQVDKIAELLVNNYPAYRVAVRGHTGPGDEDENVKLSRTRAEAVTQYLEAVHGIDGHRLHVEGRGSAQPVTRRPGESERAYLYR